MPRQTRLGPAFVLLLLLLAVAPAPYAAQRAIVNLGKTFIPFEGKASAPQTEPLTGKDDDNGFGVTGLLIRHWISVIATLSALIYLPYLMGRKKKDVEGRADLYSTTTPTKDFGECYVIKDGQSKIMEGSDHIDLSFEGIRLVLKAKKETRLLLDGSSRGRARPGRMLAIMGPSGAGKSTLLHALAGRVKESRKLKLEGCRYINGQPVAGDCMLPSAFIEQEAVFFPYMTVRETLNFRVELKLGRQSSKSIRDKIVDGLMEQVGLTKVADTIVGDAKVRGISGGERKRLSISVEMIGSPSLIFLDEPTSGLDSTAALGLVKTLRNLADSGKTVIAVIHQPSQHVFSKFDDLLLLSEGKLMYFGELKDVRSYMEDKGYPAEEEIGTAEHVLDCISRECGENESPEDANARMLKLSELASTQKKDLGAKVEKSDNLHPVSILANNAVSKSGLITQFRLLIQRSFREVVRGKAAIIVKIVQQVSIGLIYGGIYSLGNNQASIQDRFGLITLIAIGSANMAIAASIRAFPKEKAIVERELASNMYSTLPYFIAKALSELPLIAIFNGLFGTIVYHLTGLSKMPGKFMRFLTLLSTHGLASEATGLLIGAISPNSDVALAIFPAIIVLNVIFDGKNISEENIPRYLRWIPKVGLIRWGFEGLSLNEFEGLKFDTSGPRRGPVAENGKDALARFGLGGNSLADVMKVQGMIAVCCWVLSYAGLSFSRQRFLTMHSPKQLIS